jgi:hypothetical protein
VVEPSNLAAGWPLTFANIKPSALQYKVNHMDISEVLAFSKFLLPLAVSWMIFRIAKRVRYRWLRISIKTVASAFLICSVFLVFLLLMVSVGCSKRATPMYSPDGRHVAVRTYMFQGALGYDYATVYLRSRWIPWAKTAYSGVGIWDFSSDKPSEPQVRWLDGMHLLIKYHDHPGATATCVNRIEEVQIVCETLNVPIPER